MILNWGLVFLGLGIGDWNPQSQILKHQSQFQNHQLVILSPLVFSWHFRWKLLWWLAMFAGWGQMAVHPDAEAGLEGRVLRCQRLLHCLSWGGHCKLYNGSCVLELYTGTVHWKLYTGNCILELYTGNCILKTVQWKLYTGTVEWKLYTRNFSLKTLASRKRILED